MPRELKIQLPSGEVGAVLDLPGGAPRAALTLAHGAGAGMYHGFLVDLASRLVAEGFAVLRFQFPYMQAGRKMPGSPKEAISAIVSARGRLSEECPGVPVFLSGKSYGARMGTLGAAEGVFLGIQGLISFGYPLHPSKEPAVARAEHLGRIKLPHLILQGDRDELAQLDLLEGVCRKLRNVTLHVVKGADHGFDVLKSSGRTREDVMAELVREAAAFMTR